MSPECFAEIRAEMGLSFDQLAVLLGVTSRAVRYYEGGERAVSKTVELLLLRLLDDYRNTK